MLSTILYLVMAALGVYEIVVCYQWFDAWWGSNGLMLMFFFPPSILAFPFIYWFKQELSWVYLGIWSTMLWLPYAFAAVGALFDEDS